MLLVLDVGNTNTVLGVYERAAGFTADRQAFEHKPEPKSERGTPDRAVAEKNPPLLRAHWRVATIRTQTVDEYGVLFHNLFAMEGLEFDQVTGIILSSVVPPLDSVLREMCGKYFRLQPLFIEPGVKTGMPVRYENPSDVGADRIVNSVAAFEKYGGPCVAVDFGTATTFDVISERGEYLGGIIAPGIGISADALFERTARLRRVDIRKPPAVIGSTTVGSVQSGLYYGYLGLVDGILERLLAELGAQTKVVATGGLAELIASGSRHIRAVDQLLTLEGLRIIWERNQAGSGKSVSAKAALAKPERERR